MEMEAGKKSSSHELLAILLQSAGNSIELWKESGNRWESLLTRKATQRLCETEDNTQEGAWGENTDGFCETVLCYLTTTAKHFVFKMSLNWKLSTKCSLRAALQFPCNTNLLSSQGKHVKQILQGRLTVPAASCSSGKTG